jgi:two-component system phosphate regulon sensor histidine kinase PhoR
VTAVPVFGPAFGIGHDVRVTRSRRGPAQSALRRAQITLILGAVAIVLSAPIGIILLTIGTPEVVDLVAGILLLVFSSAGILGLVLGWMYLRRGSAVARSQQDFLATVSHELRTPMTSLRMFVDALLDDRLTDEHERASCLQSLRVELQRLDGLLDQLIDLSRLEAAPGGASRDPVPVTEIVDAALHAHRTITFGDRAETEPHDEIRIEVDPDIAILGDRDTLVRALVNLLSNAHKHAGPSASIRVVGRPLGQREIELAVLDRGPGLPANEQREVFGPFVRGRRALEHGTRGSGLGLSIVRSIVRAHGGRIEIGATEPQPEDGRPEGCAMRMILPRARLPQDEARDVA